MNLLSLAFGGYTNSLDPEITYDTNAEKDNVHESFAVIRVPITSLQDAAITEETFRFIGDYLWSACRGDPNSVVVAISEGTGLLSGLFNWYDSRQLNLVSVSGCYDRRKTPFKHVYSPPGNIKHHSVPWYDWHFWRGHNYHRLLLCHGVEDINPSTPFCDAYALYEYSISRRFDVSILEVPAPVHGYEVLEYADVSDVIRHWSGVNDG